MSLALETNQWVAILCGVACLAAIVVIVVAPWRRIRSEPPIPDDVETRILLGDDPKEIAEGADETPEPHLLHPAEEGQLSRVAIVRKHGDGAGLRQRLELDHTGKDGVPGEVTGQERLVACDAVAAPHRGTRFEGVDGVDEPERRSVWKQRDERVRVDGQCLLLSPSQAPASRR